MTTLICLGPNVLILSDRMLYKDLLSPDNFGIGSNQS